MSKSANRPHDRCKYKTQGNVISIGFWGVPWRKDAGNSTYYAQRRDLFARGYGRLFDLGVVNQLKEDWFPGDWHDTLHCPEESLIIQEDGTKLDLKDMAGVFCIGVAGVALGFLLRGFKHCRKHKTAKCLKKLPAFHVSKKKDLGERGFFRGEKSHEDSEASELAMPPIRHVPSNMTSPWTTLEANAYQSAYDAASPPDASSLAPQVTTDTKV